MAWEDLAAVDERSGVDAASVTIEFRLGLCRGSFINGNPQGNEEKHEKYSGSKACFILATCEAGSQCCLADQTDHAAGKANHYFW